MIKCIKNIKTLNNNFDDKLIIDMINHKSYKKSLKSYL